MESSKYNNLVFKVQSLENKLNKITSRTRRDSLDSSATYYTKHPCYYESIQNLLKLAKNIKHELRYSLKCVPKDRNTLKMYNKVDILESELYNLLNYIQPPQYTSRKRIVCGAKDSCRVVQEEPMKDSSDYSEVFPKRFQRYLTSYTTQDLDTKICYDRCFGKVTKPKYFLASLSDSFGASSYDRLSSGSSSSTVIIDQNRKPFYIRKSKISYQDQPVRKRQKAPERIPIYIKRSRSSSIKGLPSTVRKRRKTPERIPIYIKGSRGSLKKKINKRKRHKPILKKPSFQLGIHKSDSNKINVRANDLQTSETEVYLVKKKRKPSRQRERFSKSPSSGRYFVSRLKKVFSRNKSPKVRNSSTPKHKENKYYFKKHDKKKVGVSKYKNNDSGSEYSSLIYSGDDLHNEGKLRRKKPVKKRFRSKMSFESRRSSDSKPVVVANSSNLNITPFDSENRVFYLKDNNLILFPKKMLSKVKYFPFNHVTGESSYENEKTTSQTFMKPVKISNHHKNSNISNTGTDSNYEVLGSYQSSNLYLKDSDILLHTQQLSTLKSGSKHKPHSKTYESLQNIRSGERTNQSDSFDNIKKCGTYNNSNMASKNNEQSKGKMVLLNVVNDQFSLFEGKGSSTLSIKNFNSKIENNSHNERLTFDKYDHPLGINATSTAPIYLATIPQTLAQNAFQNQSLLNNTTQQKVESHNYIVSSAVGNLTNKELPNSVKRIRTISKSGSTISPTKTKANDIENSHAEIKEANSQNTEWVKLTPRNKSQTDDLRSVGSNQSSTNKKTKKWLPRSLSKLSIISKRSKKGKGEKTNKSVEAEDSKNNFQIISKQVSNEKQPTSEKISKAKSSTNFKRTMSGIGGLKKMGKNKSTEKQTALKKVESEKKLKKQPSILKRMFSRENRSKSKTQVNDGIVAEVSSTGPMSTPEFEGDETSTSLQSNHSPITSEEHYVNSNKLNGYQVGSKLNKNKGSDMKKDKPKPVVNSILTSDVANNKKWNVKNNPKAFNYSMHYSKENHKCVEMDLVPSNSCLVDCRPQTVVVKTCGSKILWSRSETILSEHELSEFEKHNKYRELFFKPNRCQGCTFHDKKVTKVCQKRKDRQLSNSQPSNSVCSYDNDHLYNCHIKYFKREPSVTTSDPVLSDGSDVCDWKKIANEIKECH